MALSDEDLGELGNALLALALGLSSVLASLEPDRRAYAREFLSRMRDGESLRGPYSRVARELLEILIPAEEPTHDEAPATPVARLVPPLRPRGGGA